MGLDLTHIIPVTCGEPNSGYEIITAEELASNPSYLDVFGSLLEEHDGIYRLYFQELGYQRKGMNSRFYKDFECDYYFNLSTVEKAFNYLHGDHITSLEEWQANFKINFIHNFIPGRSVFSVSY